MALGLFSKKLVAIDWDARNLRLVLVRPRAEGVDLLKAVSIPIPPDVKLDDAEGMGAFLREAMRQARISEKRALMSIPRDQVVLNALSLPPTPPEELPAVVQFQIVKELPFAADQATLDFAVGTGFDPKAPSIVLVAAVRNDQLSFYRRVAYEAGLTAERIGLRPHANLCAVTTKAPGLQGKTLLVIEVGPQLTEIDIIKNETLVFSRAASVTLQEYGAAGAGRVEDSRISSLEVRDREPDEAGRRAVNSLMVEIVRSFEAHRATDPSINVDHIVVCGASGIEQQLSQMLAARFATQADPYSPEHSLDLTPQRAKELRGFSAALGLALGHAQKGLWAFDFLHPKKPVSKRTVRLKKVPIAAATAVLFVLSGVTSYAKFVLPKRQQVAAVEERLEPKRKHAKNINEFKELVEALENWRDSEQCWPDVLATLSENFPSDEEVVVSRLELECRPKAKSALREAQMRARLRTAALGKVNEISAKLRELGFQDVKIGKETPIGGRREAGIYRSDTELEATLPPPVKPKRKEKNLSESTAEIKAVSIPAPTTNQGDDP